MPTATAVRSTACTGALCGDRAILISELVDSEYQLARELAAVRQLLHIALGQLHEQGLRHDRLRDQHQRVRDEYRSHRERVLHGELVTV